VQEKIDTLENEGYPTYIVGGTVRDYPAEPNDFDIATTAPLRRIRELFLKQGELVGKQHPVFYIKTPGEKDIQIGGLVSLTDYSHQESVALNNLLIYINRTVNISEDAQTRVLSINALYYRKGRIYDPRGGLVDVKNKQIRFICDPVEVIQNDPGFICRIIRLIAKLDFHMDSDTEESILNHFPVGCETAVKLNHEVFKTLLDGHSYPQIFKLFRRYHLLSKLYGFTEQEEVLLLNRMESVLAKSSLDSDENKLLLLWTVIADKLIEEVIKPLIQTPTQLLDDCNRIFQESLKPYGFVSARNYYDFSSILLLYIL
jgi:tRNA nucleotidyltransferase/poly(A) polymerase